MALLALEYDSIINVPADRLVGNLSGSPSELMAYDSATILAWVGAAPAAHTHTESDITDLGNYLENVSEDGSPQLGGELDAQGNNVIDLGDITFKTGAQGGTLQTGTSAADKFQIQAYDTGGGSYVTILELDAGNPPFMQLIDDFVRFQDNADNTKIVKFDGSGVSAMTTRTLTFPDADGTIMLNVADDTTPQLGGTLDLNGNAGSDTQLLYNNGGNLGALSSVTHDGTTFGVDSAAVFNESGADVDFRIEGLTDVNMLFADASKNSVHIGSTGYNNAKLSATGGDLYVIDSVGNPKVLFGEGTGAGEWGGLQWASTNKELRLGTQAGSQSGAGTVDTLVFNASGDVSIGNGGNSELRLYGVGTEGDTDYERLTTRYDSGNTRYEIEAEAGGTGTVRELWLLSGSSYIDIGSTINIAPGGVSRISVQSSQIKFYKPPASHSDLAENLGISSSRWATLYTGKITQQTSTAADPTTTEYPNDADWGIHENNTSGNVFLAFNNNGTIEKSHITTQKSIQTAVSDPNGVDLTTGDGKVYLKIPDYLDGYNLTVASAYVSTPSTSGDVTVQIHNATNTVDMLSTPITIDSGENDSDTAASPPVIDNANDDVADGDILRIDVDNAGTGTKGLLVEMLFEL